MYVDELGFSIIVPSSGCFMQTEAWEDKPERVKVLADVEIQSICGYKLTSHCCVVCHS